MAGDIFSNFYSFEASVSAAVTVSAPWSSRKLVVTNDSSTTNVSVTMGGTAFTLRPTESFSARFTTTKVVIGAVAGGAAAGIRVWMWG